jgi:hypothetical protein
MILSLLIAAPVLFASPEIAPQAAHLGSPAILTGRKRGYAATEWEELDRAVAEGRPVPVQCKAFVPSMFSGRPIRDKCELEIVPPHVETVAPAILSGRSPKRGEVIVGARALQYYPASTVGQSEAEAQAAMAQDVPRDSNGTAYMPAPVVKPKERRYVPSMFSGRRTRRAPSE